MIKNLIAGIIACLCFVACEEPDLVSSDVIPGTDQPGVFTDSLEVLAFTVADRPLETSNASIPMLIGTLSDQEIGSTAASLYIQMIPSTTVPSVPATAVPDSIVLSLAYSSIYGDTSATHTFGVFELAENLAFPTDSTDYFTTDTFDIVDAGIPLGSVSLVPDIHKKYTADSVPQLRIKLNQSFALNMFNKLKNNPTDLTNTEVFLSRHFKGLYIKSNTDFNGVGDVKGSVVSFHSGSTINSVTLFYRDHTDSLQTRTYSFQLGTSSVRCNRVNHSYNSGVIPADTTQTQTLLYTQSLSSVKVKVEFPDLAAFIADGPISVNRAEIVVRLKAGSTQTLKSHPQIVPTEADNSVTPDYLETGANSTLGVLDGDTYRINITQQMQKMVNGNASHFVYIEPFDRRTNALRSILEGAGSIKLNLTYTKNN